MQIKLNWLREKNFMGVKDYTLVLNGKNATVRGNNATYKTTQQTAFQWLLFGKNSDGKTDFSVKPLDENNCEIHFLETEVEAELTVDGKPLKLKKVLTENWVKPRGQEKQEYKGNTTVYYFDEVPVGANEYKSKIGAIIDEDTFKLITNPMYFCTQYKTGKLTDWQSRRVKLFEICGNMSDNEIIAASPNLAKLPEILNGKSVDDRKAIIKASIAKLNKEIDDIGPKINENQRLIPKTSVDYSDTEKQLSELRTKLDELDKQLSDAGSIAAEMQKKQRELYVLKGQLDRVKARIDEEANKGRKELLIEKQELAEAKFAQENIIRNANDTLSEYKRKIQVYDEKLTSMREKYKKLMEEKQKIQAREFIVPEESNFVCPTCFQSLPEDAKEQKIKELKENFENGKESCLRQIDTDINANISNGKAIKASKDDLQKRIAETEERMPEAEKRMQEITDRLFEIEKILLQPIETPHYTADSEYASLSSQIENLQAELEKPAEDTTADIRQQKQEIQAQIDRCNYILNNRDVAENAKKRIEELEQQEKDMSVQKSKLEGQLFLMDEFIRTKANMLSESINRRFRHVRFKLFEIQINGNLNECCEVLVNTNGCWVPYADGNTAGRINAGIDIINALIDFYGVSAPLVVDNAESVTDILVTPAQMIKLVKPEITTDTDYEKYSRLNVELEV